LAFHLDSSQRFHLQIIVDRGVRISLPLRPVRTLEIMSLVNGVPALSITKKNLLSASVGLMILLAGSTRALAQSQPSAPTWPLVSTISKGLPAPKDAELYEHDNSPLAARIPLLMIHGGGGESRPGCRMDGIGNYLNDDADFRNRFKVFYLRYDSTLPLVQSSKQAHDRILELSRAAGKPIYLIGYSMGGNVTQRALTDAQTDDAVDLVLTMGTPFHGSPLFSEGWFEYCLKKNMNYPWSKLMRTLAVRMYFKKHPQYLQELGWDNVDNNIPDVGNFRSLIGIGPRGNLVADKESNKKLARVNLDGNLTKAKFVTYSGYMANQYLLPSPKRQIYIALMTPWNFLTLKLPVYLGNERAALAVLNRDIGRMRTEARGSKFSTGTRPYVLNDGLAPVTSCVLFSPEAFQTFPILTESDLDDVSDMLDVRLARSFRNIDHVTFADGAPPRRFLQSKVVKDTMHPHEKPRMMFDWILTDIKQFHPKPMSAVQHHSKAENPPEM
jgi:pimeloyl-ACP methyl ester carboxylesterase